MVLSPLNSGATTFISNIAPHPPDTSVTSISWAWGNLSLKMDIIFCSACLPTSTPLGPFHSRDSNDILRKLDVNIRRNIVGRDVVVLCHVSILLPRDLVVNECFSLEDTWKSRQRVSPVDSESNLYFTPPAHTRMLNRLGQRRSADFSLRMNATTMEIGRKLSHFFCHRCLWLCLWPVVRCPILRSRMRGEMCIVCCKQSWNIL